MDLEKIIKTVMIVSMALGSILFAVHDKYEIAFFLFFLLSGWFMYLMYIAEENLKELTNTYVEAHNELVKKSFDNETKIMGLTKLLDIIYQNDSELRNRFDKVIDDILNNEEE